MNFRYILLSILLICVFTFTQAQNASHSSKLPWVEGQMPRIRTDGNRLIKISAFGNTLKAAKQEATKLLIQKLASERGVIVNVENITKDIYQKTENGVSGSLNAEETIRVKSEDFEAVFSMIDEYYEYNKGHYELWALFLVAENGNKLTRVPTLNYKKDKGAWRSVIILGWAQLYQKRPAIGIGMLAAEGLSLVGAFYFHSKYQENITLSNEAYKIDFKQEYRDRADNYSTISNICIGAAVGIYIYSIIDAFTSKKGIMRYSYQNNRLHFSVGNTPYLNSQQNNISFSLTYKI